MKEFPRSVEVPCAEKNPKLSKMCQYRLSLISVFKVCSNSVVQTPILFLSQKQSFVEIEKILDESRAASHANRNSFTNILLSHHLASLTPSSLQWTPTPPEVARQLNNDYAARYVPGGMRYLTCISSFMTTALWEMPSLGRPGTVSSYP